MAAASPDTSVAGTPLTHHEMLALAEPFARRGHAADLAASRRAKRRLAFQPRVHPPVTADGTAIRESLLLESYDSGAYRLVRTVERGGLVATLRVSGRDPAELLHAVEALGPERQFLDRDGVPLALSYDLDAARQRTLTRAVLRTEGIELVLSLTAVRGMAAEIGIASTAGIPLALPEDLLAVLGWDWSPLTRARVGQQGRLRLRGTPEQRGRRAAHELERAAEHLAHTLAEPPGRFHDRMRIARWTVFLRRGIPWLTVFALGAGMLMLPRLLVRPEPATLMLLFHVPTLLIAFSFCLQERAKFEIPPVPVRSGAPDWRAAAPTPRATASAMRWWNSPFR